MHFFKRIPVPANVYSTSPVRASVYLDIPHISQIVIRIPPGVMGLAGLRLLDGTFPILPANAEEWITGADELISVNVDYELHNRENVVKFEAYNEDTTYAHTFYVHILTSPSVAEVRIVTPTLPGV